MRSWVHAGATDVVMFVDDVDGSAARVAQDPLLSKLALVRDVAAAPRLPANAARVLLLPNPEPKSPASGKVRLNLILERAESASRNEWMLLLNSDIVLSPRLGRVAKLMDHSLAGTGLRINCHLRRSDVSPSDVSSVEDLQRFTNGCLAYNLGSADYFLYRRGFWQRQVRKWHLPWPDALDFYFGVGFWDNWLLHMAREDICDLSPVLLVGHVSVSGKFGEARTLGWSMKDVKVMHEPKKNDTATATAATGAVEVEPDSVHNYVRMCTNNKKPAMSNCNIVGGVLHVKRHMCPSGVVEPIADKHRYRVSMYFFRNFSRFNHWSSSAQWWLDSGRLARDMGCFDLSGSDLGSGSAGNASSAIAKSAEWERGFARPSSAELDAWAALVV